MAIEVNNLCLSYNGLRILNNLSFSAPDNSFTVLLGRNGSGKSTLLKILSGLLPYDQGSVRVYGCDINKLSNVERGRLIGYLPQFHQPIYSFSVEEVVLTGRAAYVYATPSKSDRQKVREVIERMEIAHLKNRQYTELSGGERQLVMIARVLAQDPKIILLDEPISHLDLANQQRILQLLKEITAQSIAVIAVLHDPNIAFFHADSFFFLREGHVVWPEKEEQFWSVEFIKKVYGIQVDIVSFHNKGIMILQPGNSAVNHER